MIDKTQLRYRSIGGWTPKTSLALASLAMAWIGLSASARAQEEGNAADVAAARTLAVDGLKLADAGSCAEAIDKLARAERLHHAPIVLGRLGECQILQGKIVEGTEALRRLLREPLPSNPPPALLKARERAQAALDAAKPKIAVLTISVKGVRDGLSVTVDGQPVPAAVLDSERPTDPGDRLVEATAPGFLKASRQVKLGPGDRISITLELQPDPQAAIRAEQSSPAKPPPSARPGAPAPAAAPAPSSAVEPEPTSPNRTGAYVAWGIGGAALVAGGIFGGLAASQKSDLDGECPNGVCPANSRGKLDSALLAGNISTVLLGVAGAGLALGTVLYITGGSSSVEHPTTARGAEPWIGLGTVGVNGRF